MAKVSAKWIGKAELTKRMLRLEPAIEKYVHPALAKAGDDLVAMQKRFAPVAATHGGELRDSIKWSWDEDNKLAIRNTAGDREAYYARLVEFGTVRTPKQAFFFPAYRTLKRPIKTRIRSAVRKAVRSG